MRFKTCALTGLGLLFLGLNTHGEQTTCSTHETTKEALQAHVKFLSSEALEGRLTGSAGEKQATQYVADLFRCLGLEPAGDQGTFFQEFDFTSKETTKHIPKRGRNVLAKLKISHNATPILVIGAHADHLGRGDLSGTHTQNKGLIHYGADDNASGVASVLEAAVELSRMKANNTLLGDKDILFAIWSGEEVGLLGSTHFVKKLMKSTNNKSLHPTIDANINLDMVGRLRKSLVLQGSGSSTLWPKLIAQSNAKHPLPLIIQKDPYLPTDSTSFYLHGVPTLNLFTGAHDEYHTARDKPDTLNYAGMERISEFLVQLILTLENQPQAINYSQVSKPKGNSGGGFRVYFGTIPDYTSSDISGVKLTGVTKDSPAEQAGVKPEDVIIKLAGKTIHDIYDYSSVLRALHVGDSVPLVVLRGSKTVTMTITAHARE